IVLVFEDLHRLTNPAITSDLGTVALSLPPNVRMLVTSRWDPPWALTPLRLDARVVELRGRDLAFDVHAGREMLDVVSGRTLSDAQVVKLVERTAGWAAGLQLAGISLQEASDPDQVIDELTGNDRSIGEYLLEEVVD